jgi:hypothetical protein
MHKKASQLVLKGFCDLGEARTLDPLIKSQLLYQLSYQVVLLERKETKIILISNFLPGDVCTLFAQK